MKNTLIHPLTVLKHCGNTQTETYVKAHTYTLSQSHTLPPRLRDLLFSHRHVDYFGTLIYSAVIVVFSHFLFGSSTLIYSAHLLFTSKRRQYPNLLLPSSPVKTKANISLWGKTHKKHTNKHVISIFWLYIWNIQMFVTVTVTLNGLYLYIISPYQPSCVSGAKQQVFFSLSCYGREWLCGEYLKLCWPLY